MDHWKNLADGLAIGSGIAVIISLVPVVTGVLSIVWLTYRIIDIRLSVKIKRSQLKDLEK